MVIYLSEDPKFVQYGSIKLKQPFPRNPQLWYLSIEKLKNDDPTYSMSRRAMFLYVYSYRDIQIARTEYT
jgi:hypothetical protein